MSWTFGVDWKQTNINVQKNVHITIACKVSNLHNKETEFPGGPDKLRTGTFKFCDSQ